MFSVLSTFRTMIGVGSLNVVMPCSFTIFQWIKLVVALLSTKAFRWMLRFASRVRRSKGIWTDVLFQGNTRTNSSVGKQHFVRNHVTRCEPTENQTHL